MDGLVYATWILLLEPQYEFSFYDLEVFLSALAQVQLHFLNTKSSNSTLLMIYFCSRQWMYLHMLGGGIPSNAHINSFLDIIGLCFLSLQLLVFVPRCA